MDAAMLLASNVARRDALEIEKHSIIRQMSTASGPSDLERLQDRLEEIDRDLIQVNTKINELRMLRRRI